MAIKRCPADDAFSKCARLAKDYTCEYCGKESNSEAAHIYSRRHKSVRWDTMNILCLCSYHHRYFTENPIEFTRWLEQYLGHGHLELLNEKRNSILKTNAELRKQIAKHYREEYKRMESTGARDLQSW